MCWPAQCQRGARTGLLRPARNRGHRHGRSHLALGRLPARLLGGEIVLDEDAAHQALDRLARRQEREPKRVTVGIIEITTHAICGAIRRMLAAPAGMSATMHCW